ncbi:hypothetical protein [Streptomyces sp. NPDC059828]|uniref:hypothetical protein n=1 Tax=Streptomyces sp. NPDC059828 TaxID=3346965 RepID=UPI0036595581
MEALSLYLADRDPAVRTAAVAALGETVPTGARPSPAERLREHRPQVRAGFGAGLREALGVADPAAVRAAVLDVLRALRLGDTGVYATALADTDTDTDTEVRVTAGVGLGLGWALINGATQSCVPGSRDVLARHKYPTLIPERRGMVVGSRR